MILGYHLSLGAYGFWLPNDPRGSWSTEVRMDHLRPFGPASKVDSPHSHARDPHDHARRQQAKHALWYPPVKFDGLQARAVARGIAEICGLLNVEVYALAVMPDHLHLVTRRHRLDANRLAGFLARAATRQLNREGINPMTRHAQLSRRTPSPWCSHAGWRVFLNSHEAMRHAIDYVERNPLKAGLRAQRWSCVIPYPQSGAE